jgi:Leucine-rich repeat (LRR) protein
VLWTSSSPEIVSVLGEVTIPQTLTAVVLTATVSRGTSQLTRDFAVTVLGLDCVATIPFADPKLREAVLKSTAGSPYIKDYHHQMAASAGITDLTGVESLTELTLVRLEGNQIRDITPLSRVQARYEMHVNLVGNPLESIEPLRGMSILGLELSGLTCDLSPVATLSGLRTLRLVGCRVSDAGFVAGFRSLSYLDLRDNQIADVSFVAALLSLDTLYLGRNQIADIGPFAGLSRLRNLSLDDNQVRDLGPLAGHPSLLYLNLQRNGITDVSPLMVRIPGLYDLWLHGNPGIASADIAALRQLYPWPREVGWP